MGCDYLFLVGKRCQYLHSIFSSEFEDHEERVGETKKAIRLLPHSHFHTLKALIEHLSRSVSNYLASHFRYYCFPIS